MTNIKCVTWIRKKVQSFTEFFYFIQMWSEPPGFSSVINASEMSVSVPFCKHGRAAIDASWSPECTCQSSTVSPSDSLSLCSIEFSWFNFYLFPGPLPPIHWEVDLLFSRKLAPFYFPVWAREIFYLHWISSQKLHTQAQVYKWQQYILLNIT